MLLFGLSLFVPNAALAQDDGADRCAPPKEKKVARQLAEATGTRNPSERHQKLKAVLEEFPECMECLYLTGESAYQRAKAGAGGFSSAITYLERLEQTCPEYHSDMYFYLGTMYFAQSRYKEASNAFDTFMHFPSDDPDKFDADVEKKRSQVERILPELAFYTDFYSDQRPDEPTILRGVSTPADEYLPMFSPDNERIFFTRIKQYQAKGDRFPRDVEELTASRRTDVRTDFGPGEPLPPPFNTGDSYGGVTVSLNNKELFVTICRPGPTGQTNCDIYRTHYETSVDLSTGKQNFQWGPLVALGPQVNTPDGWESQPSLSADGHLLFFATIRRGSRRTDIYTSERNAKGEWGEAQPLPAPITTDGDEKAPFFHSDGRTLYFAARPPRDEQGHEEVEAGHRGIGGYDIFYSRLADDGSWSRPKNIGNPINTPQDEHGLIVSADGRTGYFASSRPHNVGGLDIYGYELPELARPENIIIAKGQVKDEEGHAVTDATVTITYMDTRKTEILHVDSTDGRYATVLKLKAGSDVILTVKKEDHVFDSRSFTIEDTIRGGVADVDMRLAKIEVGKSYRVSDIRYATNSAEITGASRYILDELIGFLNENPSISIEVQGHTDNVGALADNMRLSEDRALTVADYLEAQGISPQRLTSIGLGPTMPVASNDTEIGRASNRRTAFVIVKR